MPKLDTKLRATRTAREGGAQACLSVAVSCWLAGGAATSRASDARQSDAQMIRLAEKPPAYKVIGSGPIVVGLTLDMQETLYDSGTTDTIVPRLLSAGYAVMSLDLPCHGVDAEPGVQSFCETNPHHKPIFWLAFRINGISGNVPPRQQEK
jgi:hypothetical protein